MKSRAEYLAEKETDYRIKKRVKAGELFKVGKAIYSEDKYVPEIAVLAHRYPKAVVTMHNAFYMHGLTDVVPERYDLATNRNAAKIQDEQVRQFFSPEGFFEVGVETIEYKGYPVRIYSKERMLIELLRYKSKLPFDYYKEILLNYRKIIPQLNIQLIQEYAYRAPKKRKVAEMLQAEVM